MRLTTRFALAAVVAVVLVASGPALAQQKLKWAHVYETSEPYHKWSVWAAQEIEKAKLDGAGSPLVELLVHSALSPSKGQARKDIEGGGVYVNNVRESKSNRTISTNDLLFGRHLLLRKGKRNYVVVTAK